MKLLLIYGEDHTTVGIMDNGKTYELNYEDNNIHRFEGKTAFDNINMQLQTYGDIAALEMFEYYQNKILNKLRAEVTALEAK